ncbi:MAG: hypothetical protein KGZ42_10960 [Melioribacter sp.]|nr:hypothetical protein [Melioribacter sp.]
MKKFTLILFMLTISSCWINLAQSLSLEEKNRIIADLDSLHSVRCLDALDDVVAFGMNEALPKIENNFWSARLRMKPLFLYALRRLHSSRAYEFAKGYLDSLKTYPGIDTTDFYLDKSYAITILFDNNDFSYSNYVLSLLCCNESQYKRALSLLYYIINFDTVNSQRAMELLINATQNAESPNVRSSALFYYNFIKGKEALPLLINSYLNDKDARVRGRLLKPYFFKEYSSPEIETALRSKIQQEDDPTNRREASFILLRNYHNPINYKIISELEKVETDPFTKRFLKGEIDYYVVRRPSKTLGTTSLIDSLFSYMNQIHAFSWLKDEGYKNQLLGKIQEAKNYLSSFDSVNCYKQIKSFQTSIQQVYSDSAGSYPKYVSKDAYKFLYYYPQYILERLPSPPTVKLENSQGKLLPDGSLQYYEGGWKPATNNGDGTFYLDTKLKTVSLRMTYEYGSQTMNNVPLSKDAIVFKTVNTKVKLIDSKGTPLDSGAVQYYAGGWRNFGKTENGVATKELLAGNYSFRMTYAYASTDKSQNLDTNSTIVFTTKNTIVELRNSSGQLIDGGEVQYYSGGWRIFGTASGGISQKELLPNTYSFRMTYGYGSNDKQQNTDTNPIVVFNTIKADVELRDSRNNLLDQGVVQYYSGAWRDFGTTVNGVATKELLPNNYSFRMSYAYSSNDKQQNIGVDPTVVFQTVNSIVQLKNSLGNLIDQGTVQYYSGAWRDFGTTINGEVTKELLPNNYSFRMSYAFASNDKQQNIGTTPTVVFQTVNTSVELRNSQNNLMGEGVVQYYSGGWRTFGTTVGGIANLELLPNNYSFRMTHEYIALDKSQNTGTSNVVTFTTVQCRVIVRGNQNQPINNAAVRYYAGAWRNFGTTINGEVTKELLPINLTLRAIVGTAQQDKTQNLLTNPLVEFIF